MEHDPIPSLSAEDREVLDMLMECGFDVAQLPPMSAERRRRVDAVRQVFGLISDYPVEDADDLLIDATMARLRRLDSPAVATTATHASPSLSFAAQQSTRPLRFDADPAPRRAWRIPDVVSIAAIVLILAGIAIPVMSHVRRSAIDSGCSNNMRVLADAFTQYASDFEGQLPMARAGIGHGWDMFSNTLHLRPLIDQGYCDQGHLNCPGNHDHAGPSYSYQLQSPDRQYIWGVATPAVVLADRNPLIDAARALRVPPPANSLSANHGNRGQNVLQSDGAVVFLIQPAHGNDNIWLPEGKRTLSEGDEPASFRDIFLAH